MSFVYRRMRAIVSGHRGDHGVDAQCRAVAELTSGSFPCTSRLHTLQTTRCFP